MEGQRERGRWKREIKEQGRAIDRSDRLRDRKVRMSIKRKAEIWDEKERERQRQKKRKEIYLIRYNIR